MKIIEGKSGEIISGSNAQNSEHGDFPRGNSDVHWNISPLPSSSIPELSVVPPEVPNSATHEQNVTIKLSDIKIPSISFDLDKPYERAQFSNTDCAKLLNTASQGLITSPLMQLPVPTVREIITSLDEERRKKRVALGAHLKIGERDIIGLPSDELERKLYDNHFKNRESQHRAFTIAFSVAVFAIIIATIASASISANKLVLSICTYVGILTTTVGLIGYASLKFFNKLAEKRAARLIQELAILDTSVRKIKDALV